MPASFWLCGVTASRLTGDPPPRRLEHTGAAGSTEVKAARASSRVGVANLDNLLHGSVTQPPNSRSPAGTDGCHHSQVQGLGGEQCL